MRTAPDETDSLDDAIRRRDIDAIVEEGWRAYHAPLRAYLLRNGVGGADVDDVLLDVFARVLEGIETFWGGSFRAWLYTIAAYEVMAWHTQQRREARGMRRARQRTELLDESPGLDATMSALAVLDELRSKLDPINLSIFECLITHQSEADVLDRVALEHGLQISLDGLRGRRRRIRSELAHLMVLRGVW